MLIAWADVESRVCSGSFTFADCCASDYIE